MAGSGEHVDLERFLSVLEGVRTVPFSGEFSPDGSFHAPYTGPGIHLLLGGDLPDGIDGGEFWATRVLPADRAVYDDGMALQRSPHLLEEEYGLYFKVARLFAKVIGNPALLGQLTKVGMQSRSLMEWVLRIRANLLREDELGPAEAAYKAIAAIVRVVPEPGAA